MSHDLQDLFNDAGRAAPPATLDTDYVIRRGRRVRARRRVAVGTTALVSVGLVGVGVAAVGSTALVGSPGTVTPGQSGLATAADPGVIVASATAPVVSPVPTTSLTPADMPTPPAALAAVKLADPAPGFPVRRWKDGIGPEQTGPGTPIHWVADFGLAVKPEIMTTSSSGGVSGGPNGPEVTMFVGTYTTPLHLSGLSAHPISGSPTVAGVTGHLAQYTEKGTTFTVLYFSTGQFTVEIIGSHVTPDQLVALGDALTGLQ